MLLPAISELRISVEKASRDVQKIEKAIPSIVLISIRIETFLAKIYIIDKRPHKAVEIINAFLLPIKSEKRPDGIAKAMKVIEYAKPINPRSAYVAPKYLAYKGIIGVEAPTPI